MSHNNNYTIVFIDDEAITIRLLEVAVDWAAYGIAIVGSAQSAREGLELVQRLQPDIVIVDIRMPGLSGMEFAEQVRQSEQGRHIKLVLLSAYAEFEYARQALSYGISEYLLKPLDETKLEALLQKLLPEIDEERQMRRTLAEEQLLRQVQAYRHTGQDAVLQTDCHSAYCILVASPVPAQLRGEILTPCLGACYLAVSPEPGELLLLTAEESPDPEGLYRAMARYGMAVRIGACRAVYTCADLAHACVAVERTLFTRRATQCYEALPPAVPVESDLSAWRHSVMLLIGQADAAPLLSQLRDFIWQCVPDTDPGMFLGILRELLHTVREETLRAYPGELEVEEVTPLQLRLCPDRDALFALLQARLQRLAGRIHDCQTQDSPLAVVRRAKAYTKAQFQRSDLTLQETAAHVGLSKNHFSKVFHDSTGMKYWDYVTQIRLERACELLRTDMPVAEICQAIGYETESHFNRTFKKQMGETPGKYRREHS